MDLSGPDAAWRDQIAEELTEALHPALEDLLDELTASLSALLPRSRSWSARQRAAFRHNLRRLAEGFLEFLRQGDLEVSRVEHLRTRLAAPIPDSPSQSGLDLAPSLRLQALQTIRGRLRGVLGDQALRLLDRELERYLSVLRPPEHQVTSLSSEEFDAWLAEVEATGTDVA